MVPPNPRHRVLANAIAVALPFWVYILSIGPVSRLVADQPQLKPLRVIYRPLLALARQSKWSLEFLDWYVHDACGAPPIDRRSR